MKTITLQDIRKHGAKCIPENEIAYLIVHSRPRCVFVPIKEYEMMIESLNKYGKLVNKVK